jgi:endonuclease-3
MVQLICKVGEKMTKKQIALQAVEALKKEYPDAICSLTYTDPLQLLIATRLAAQCTDARVNMVTPALFERFPDAKAFADAQYEEVEEYIKSCGLYKTKAKDLVELGKMLVNDFDSTVPDTLEELITLPGIGRKTANLVMGDIFKKPAVVVDTHCIRITRRLGLHNEKDAKKIEFILRDLLPEDESNDFCHRIVLHGRAVCTARKAMCENCCMSEFCRKKP